MFNELKAAQIAAWFIAQEGGSMPHLKLMKLMYLAERASLQAHGRLLTGDRFVSMPHGPALSTTLNHINDEIGSKAGGWDSWISDKANYMVALLRDVSRDVLDELSDAEMHVLEKTWKQFGWMTKYQIRDWTHDKKNIPEWDDPDGSSLPIEYAKVMEALGFDPAASDETARQIREQAQIQRSLAR